MRAMFSGAFNVHRVRACTRVRASRVHARARSIDRRTIGYVNDVRRGEHLAARDPPIPLVRRDRIARLIALTRATPSLKRSRDTGPTIARSPCAVNALDCTSTIHGRNDAASPFAGHIARSLTARTPDR